MRIISKYKDYYDYLKGIYGEDDKLVLDRREFKTPYLPTTGIITLYICDNFIQGYIKNGKIYWKDELKELGKWNDQTKSYHIDNGNWNRDNVVPDLTPSYRKVNTELDCPIVIRDIFGNYAANSENFNKFPKLDELGLNKVIPAHDMWIMLSEWLSQRITRSEPSVPIGDDKTRLLSHGFDVKTSFRGK